MDANTTLPYYDRPDFIASIACSGAALVVVVLAHLHACSRCLCGCWRKKGAGVPLKWEEEQLLDEAARCQTPVINDNDEGVPLLGHKLPSTTHASDPGPDGYRWLDNLFLTWNLPLIVLGWGAPLPRKDFPALPGKFESTKVHATVSELWEQEKRRPAPSLTRVLLTLLRPKLAAGVCVSMLQGLISSIARPLVLRYIINELEDEDLTIDEIVTSLAALGMTVFVEGWLGVLFRHLLSEDLGTSFLTATFSLLLDKITVLAVRPNADDDDDDKDEELGTNDIANLLGNDIMKRFRDFLIASNLPMATAAFSGSLGTLLYVLGLPSLAGVGCMVVMTLVNLRIARKLGGIEATILKASDKRIGILTEIVASIKAVKFFAWERPYMDKLSAARTDEVTRIQRFRLWQVTSIAIGRSAPAISACAAIVTYALLGNPLRAGDIFATLAVFQGLRLALIVLPHALAAVETLKVSLKRLQQFMDQEEAPERTPTAAAEGGVLVVEAATIGWPVTKTRVQRNEMKIVQSNSALKDLKACGVITDTEFDDISTRVTASILRNNIVLTGVSLRLKPGEIAAVVGKVGSGKSTLLSTIVGDVQCMSGVLRSAGSLGYVPQRAVIVSGSVRENILFGREYSTELLNAALYASDFVHDVKMLADGIDTEIGERGTTLSGGQQQRLSIARAVYGKPKLLVLDDPLSAVDPEVCNRIFNRTILALKGSGQSVIIACSQVHLLPHFDHILHLQGGAVSEQGSYSELLALGGSVASLVNEHAHEQGSNKPPAGDAETYNASASMKQSSDFAEASALKHKKQHTSRKGEARQTGTMKNSVPVAYFTAMGWCLFAAIIAIITMAYGIMAFNDMWLTIWIQKAAEYGPSDRDELPMSENLFYGGIFIGGSVGYTGLVWVGSALYTVGGFRASQALHSVTISKVLYAPFAWFQDTPIGRITSRYTTDLSSVDQELSLWLDNLSQLGMQLLAMAVVMIYIVPPVAFPIGVGLVLYQFFSVAVNRTNRECKREANTASWRALVAVAGESGAQHAAPGRF